MGAGVFAGCESLRTIIVPNIIDVVGRHVLFGKDTLLGVELPASVTILNDNRFVTVDNKTVLIPFEIKEIGACAFNGCRALTRIKIPSGITSIGEGTFSTCSSLTSVTIPESVTSIEFGAFAGCGSLMDVTIPKNLENIGWGAFWGCYSLKSITIPRKTILCTDVFPKNCQVIRE